MAVYAKAAGGSVALRRPQDGSAEAVRARLPLGAACMGPRSARGLAARGARAEGGNIADGGGSRLCSSVAAWIRLGGRNEGLSRRADGFGVASRPARLAAEDARKVDTEAGVGRSGSHGLRTGLHDGHARPLRRLWGTHAPPAR